MSIADKLQSVASQVANELMNDTVVYYDENSMRGITIGDMIRLHKDKVRGKAELSRGFSRLQTVLGGQQIPKQFTPKKPALSNKYAVRVIQEAGIRTLAPQDLVLLPEMVKDGEGEMPDVTKVPHRPTEFWPMYRTVGFDVALFKELSSLISTDPQDRSLRSLYEHLYDIADTSFYGNGSLQGQLGRYKAVAKVGMEVRKSVFYMGVMSQYGQPVDYRAYSETMRKRFPLGKRPGWMVLDTYDLIEVDALFEQNGLPSSKIQMGSDPGMIWKEGATREDVIVEDLELARWMLQKVASVQAAEEFHKVYPWVRLAKMKPKAEVYTQQEFYTKTRNIFVTHSFAFLPAHIMMLHAHRESPNCLEDEDSWSLLGWTPFRGGMKKLVQFLQRKAIRNKYHMVTYADNLYAVVVVGGRHLFLSIDGEKMEGSITFQDVFFYNQRILDQYWDEDSLSEGWRNYLYSVNPSLVVDVPAAIFNQQMATVGMASGAVGTAYYNTAKMMRAIAAFRALPDGETRIITKTDDGYALHADFLLACSSVGVKLKLEAVTDITGMFEKPGSYRMDILGFDIIHMDLLDMKLIIPVLNRDRLLRAVLFNKKYYDKNGKAKINEKVSLLLRLIKLRALYLVGGWADVDLADLIRQYADNVLNQLGDSNVIGGIETVRQALRALEDDALISIMEVFGDDANVMDYLGRRSVPTVYEVIKLVVGEDEAYDLIGRVAFDKALAVQVGHFIPEALLLDLLEKGTLEGHEIPEDVILQMIDSQLQAIHQLPGGAEPALPKASASKVLPPTDWEDLEDEGLAQKPRRIKLSTAGPTNDPFRKRMGKKAVDRPEPKQDQMRQLMRIIAEGGKTPTVMLPKYYRDRPEEIRDQVEVSRRIYADDLAARTKIRTDVVLTAIRSAGVTPVVAIIRDEPLPALEHISKPVPPPKPSYRLADRGVAVPRQRVAPVPPPKPPGGLPGVNGRGRKQLPLLPDLPSAPTHPPGSEGGPAYGSRS